MLIFHEQNKTCHNVVLEVVVLEVGNGWKLMKGGYHGKNGKIFYTNNVGIGELTRFCFPAPYKGEM